jgi:hypothetical protein
VLVETAGWVPTAPRAPVDARLRPADSLLA